MRPYRPGNCAVAGGARVNAIRLVQVRLTCDAFEQERDERGVVFPGEAREDGPKSARVLRAEVWRCFHTGDDEVGVRVPFAGVREDCVQVGLHLVGAQAAQAVVRAQLEKQDFDRLLEGPLEATQSAG